MEGHFVVDNVNIFLSIRSLVDWPIVLKSNFHSLCKMSDTDMNLFTPLIFIHRASRMELGRTCGDVGRARASHW